MITAERESAVSGAAAGKAGYLDRIYLSSPKQTEVRLASQSKTLYIVQQSSSWPDTTLCKLSVCGVKPAPKQLLPHIPSVVLAITVAWHIFQSSWSRAL